jgi:Pyruvate/2-oxoacid:ferredoxin oxidoreductase gamma subunit
VVLLGALSNILGGEEETWLEVIRDLVPEKFLDLNEKAFHAGRAYSAA